MLVAVPPWHSATPMPERRSYFAAAQVGGGIYVAGGMVGGLGTYVLRVERFDARTDQWTREPDLPGQARAAAGAAVGSSLYVVGGQTSKGVSRARLCLRREDAALDGARTAACAALQRRGRDARRHALRGGRRPADRSAAYRVRIRRARKQVAQRSRRCRGRCRRSRSCRSGASSGRSAASTLPATRSAPCGSTRLRSTPLARRPATARRRSRWSVRSPRAAASMPSPNTSSRAMCPASGWRPGRRSRCRAMRSGSSPREGRSGRSAAASSPSSPTARVVESRPLG